MVGHLTGNFVLSDFRPTLPTIKDPRVALTTEGVTNFEGVDMTYISAFSPSPIFSHKENYLRYLDSRQWQEVKRAYWFSGRPKECWACGKRWELGAKGFNFHHISYKNLYRETPEDLVLLCAPHHQDYEKKKGDFNSQYTLEIDTYVYICHERIDRGLSIFGVTKFMKGLID